MTMFWSINDCLKMKMAIFIFRASCVILLYIKVVHCKVGSRRPFPLKQFLQSDDRELLMIYKRFHLCNGIDSQMSESQCCSCHNCMWNHTCCADALWYSKNYENISVYVDDLLSQAANYKKHRCVHFYPNVNTNHNFYAVQECLSGANQSDVEMCLSEAGSNPYTIILPVIGYDGLVYRNLYCAKCNSVEQFEPIPILYKGKLIDLPKFTLLGVTECLGQDKALFHTFCLPGDIYYDLCRAYVDKVMDGYDNYFCWLCYQENRKKENITITSPVINSNKFCTGRPNAESFEPDAWSSILRLRPSSNENSDGKSVAVTRACDLLDLYSFITENCFRCPLGYHAIRDRCIKAPVLSSPPLGGVLATFDRCLSRNKLSLYILNSSQSTMIAEEILRGVNLTLNMEMPIFKGDESFLELNESVNEKIKTYILHDSKRLQGFLGEDGYIVISRHQIIKGLFKNSLAHIFPGGRLCASPIELENVSLTNDCDILSGGALMMDSNTTSWIEINSTSISRRLYICQSFYLTKACSLQILSSNVTVMPDKSLMYHRSVNISGIELNQTEIYNTSEYIPLLNNRFGVCRAKDNSPVDSMELVSVIEGYISFVGSICSMFCYILFIIIFVSFKELHNIPGICIFLLCLSLFCGDAMFIVSNVLQQYVVSRPGCLLIGVLIHFSLLSSQFWGVLAALNASKGVVSKKISQEKFHRKIIIKYCVICFSIVFPIVLIGLLLDVYNVLDVSYTSNNLCFLQGFYARLLLFYTPMLISTGVSVSCLAALIYRLHEHMTRMRRNWDSNSSSNCLPILALRLVIICGLTESIGLVTAMVSGSSDYIIVARMSLDMLYTIFKSFRGVMLFIVYTCRQNFITLFRKRFFAEKTSNAETNVDVGKQVRT